MKPLITLSLTQDLRTAKNLCAVIDTTNLKRKGCFRLTLNDFMRVLRPDRVIDTLKKLVDDTTSRRHLIVEAKMRKQFN